MAAETGRKRLPTASISLNFGHSPTYFSFQEELMIRQSMFTGLLFALCAAVLAPSAQANEAEQVFRECSERLHRITTECNAQIVAIGERCIPQIRELLRNGRREAALELARRCIGEIEAIEVRCNRAIDELCRHCVHRLNELNAPELARRFAERCRIAKASIHETASRVKHAIRSLFR
jgi:hypothetical protein